MYRALLRSLAREPLLQPFSAPAAFLRSCSVYARSLVSRTRTHALCSFRSHTSRPCSAPALTPLVRHVRAVFQDRALRESALFELENRAESRVDSHADSRTESCSILRPNRASFRHGFALQSSTDSPSIRSIHGRFAHRILRGSMRRIERAHALPLRSLFCARELGKESRESPARIGAILALIALDFRTRFARHSYRVVLKSVGE